MGKTREGRRGRKGKEGEESRRRKGFPSPNVALFPQDKWYNSKRISVLNPKKLNSVSDACYYIKIIPLSLTDPFGKNSICFFIPNLISPHNIIPLFKGRAIMLSIYPSLLILHLVTKSFKSLAFLTPLKYSHLAILIFQNNDSNK